MGTNYYAYDKEPCPHCHRGWPGLHVGKSSAGWMFCFARYEDLGLVSAKTWYEWLEHTGALIIDEYKRSVSLKELKELVQSKQDGLWELTNPNRTYLVPNYEYLDEDGYRISKHWDFS